MENGSEMVIFPMIHASGTLGCSHVANIEVSGCISPYHFRGETNGKVNLANR